jgi:hypothetical protein
MRIVGVVLAAGLLLMVGFAGVASAAHRGEHLRVTTDGHCGPVTWRRSRSRASRAEARPR